MRRLLLPASLTLAVLLPAAAPSLERAAVRTARADRPGCHHRLFTVAMAERAARKIYRGTRDVSVRDLRLLTRLKACERNRAAEPFVYRYYQRERRAWASRRYEAAHPWQPGTLASTWYDDGGATSSGSHAYYGFAACGGAWCVPMYTKVQFCSEITGACVTGIRDDSGPYAGADVDVNEHMAAVLGEDAPSSPGRVPLRWRYP